MVSTTDDEPRFDSIANFRDVATLVNNAEQSKVIRKGRLFRSARPDTASTSDKRRLVEDHKLQTIVDLRSKTEHIEAAKKLGGSVQSHRITGIRYIEINLNGRGFERFLVWQLSYWNLLWLILYMVLGYHLQGISIISQNVLQPRGLSGLGRDTLEHSGPEIRQVFNVLADPENYPVLIHCTQGKDRTGLIIILTLMLCGARSDVIAKDYTLSETELEVEFEERMKEIKSIGLDESFARCPKTFVNEMVRYIHDRHGSIERYLNSIGISNDQMDQIRKNLKIESPSN